MSQNNTPTPHIGAKYGEIAPFLLLAVEMEAAALYMNAARSGNKAMALFTISDHLLTGDATTSEERQTTFTRMMDVALSLL